MKVSPRLSGGFLFCRDHPVPCYDGAMTSNRRNVLAEMEQLKEALRASERRAKREAKRRRDLEGVLTSLTERMKFWADSPLPDENNAARIMTVGECRRIVSILEGEEKDGDASLD